MKSAHFNTVNTNYLLQPQYTLALHAAAVQYYKIIIVML